MAVVAWLTVVTGTWMVYPWYRQADPSSPRSRLLADPSTAGWHVFGMEWKEHGAWVAPILATAVAYAVSYYREDLAHRTDDRRAALVLFTIAFLTAGVARDPRRVHQQGRVTDAVRIVGFDPYASLAEYLAVRCGLGVPAVTGVTVRL